MPVPWVVSLCYTISAYPVPVQLFQANPFLRREEAAGRNDRRVVGRISWNGTRGFGSPLVSAGTMQPARGALRSEWIPQADRFGSHRRRGIVMSGHSKWATIKHKKAATAAKRGRVFTRLIREISIAARGGGGDPDTNPRLRTAIAAAKNENMPNENIERAVLRGTGQLEGEQYEEVTFEGYGPGGVGVLIQVVTSSRNRVVSEIRHVMSKNGGSLAEAGAVGWMFHRKGEIIVPKEQAGEDKMLNIVLDAGAEDLKDDGSAWDVVTPPELFEAVRDALVKAGITPASAEIAMVPQNYVKPTGPQAAQMLRPVETLEEHDDVQHVYANFDIDEKEIQAVVGAA